MAAAPRQRGKEHCQRHSELHLNARLLSAASQCSNVYEGIQPSVQKAFHLIATQWKCEARSTSRGSHQLFSYLLAIQQDEFCAAELPTHQHRPSSESTEVCRSTAAEVKQQLPCLPASMQFCQEPSQLQLD